MPRIYEGSASGPTAAPTPPVTPDDKLPMGGNKRPGGLSPEGQDPNAGMNPELTGPPPIPLHDTLDSFDESGASPDTDAEGVVKGINARTNFRPLSAVPDSAKPTTPPPNPDPGGPLFHGLVDTRVQHMPQDFVQGNPDVAASLATSTIPESHVQNISNLWAPALSWIMQSHTFNDSPGALIGARLKALSIKDPKARQDANETIASLQSLSPTDQSLFVTYAKDPAAFQSAFQALPNGQMEPTNSEGAGVAGGIQALLPGAQLTTSGVNLPQSTEQDQAAIQHVADIETLFPQLKGKIHFTASGLSVSDFAYSYSNTMISKVYTAAGMSGEGAYTDEQGNYHGPTQTYGDYIRQHGIAGSLGHLAFGSAMLGLQFGVVPGGGEALGALGNIGGEAAVEGGADAAAGAGEASGLAGSAEGAVSSETASEISMGQAAKVMRSSIFGNAMMNGQYVGAAGNAAIAALPFGLGKHLTGMEHAAGNVARFAQGVMQYDGQSIGTVELRAAGKTPENDPNFDEQANMWGQATLMPVLHVASEGIAAAHTSAGIEPEAAAGELGLPIADNDRATARAAVSQSLFGGSPLGEEGVGLRGGIEHPFRAVVDPAVRAWVYNLVKMTPEEWVTRGAATSWFGKIQSVIDDANDKRMDPVSAVMTYEPTMDEGMAKTLVDAGQASDMPANYLDYVRHNNERVVDAVGDAQRLVEVNKARGQVADSIQRELGNREGTQPVQVQDAGGVWRTVKQAPRLEAPKETAPAVPPEGIEERRSADQIPPAALPKGYYYDEKGVLRMPNGFISPSDSRIADLTDSIGRGPAYRRASDVPQDVTPPTSQDDLAGMQDMLDSLNAEKAALEDKLSGAPTTLRTNFDYPGQKSLPKEFHRVFEHPATEPEQMLRGLLTPINTIKAWTNSIFRTDYFNTDKEAFLQKFTDKMDNYPVIYDMSQSGKNPKGALDRNVTLINRIGHRMGWSEEDINAVQSQFRTVASNQDFYKASIALQDMFQKNLPRNTPAAIRSSFQDWWKRGSDDYQMGFRDDQGNRVPVLSDENGRAVPSVPSEFQDGLKLPNIEQMAKAMSPYRRWIDNSRTDDLSPSAIKRTAARMAQDPNFVRQAEQQGVDTSQEGAVQAFAADRLMAQRGHGPVARAVATSIDGAEWLLRASTSVLKPVSLVMHIPGIIVKKTLDESLGNVLSPNLSSSLRSTDEFVRGALRGSTEDIGAGNVADLLNHESGARWVHDMPTDTLLANGDPAVWSTRVSQMDFMRSDPMVREMIHQGFDEGKFLDRVESDPDLAQQFADGPEKTLAEHGMDKELWAKRLSTSVKQMTLGDKAIQDYVAHGRILTDGSLSSEDTYRWQQSQDTIDAARARLKEDDVTDEEARVLNDRIGESMERQSHIETENGIDDPSKVNVRSLKPGQPRKIASYLRQRYEEGDLNMPDKIDVDRYSVSSDGNGKPGVRELGHENARAFSEYLYRRFKSIGRFERSWARGNFFEQRALQSARAYYNEGGMTPKQAMAFGEADAGDATRDMMYDLSSRSSMERSVKNVFWYAPLTGEMLYRWAYQIPAQYGWVAGLAVTAAKASNFFNLMKSVGLLHQDSNGNYLLPIPGAQGLASVMNHALPASAQMLIPGSAGIPIESLAHIVPTAPTLSPLLAFGFSRAEAKTHSQALMDIGNAIDPYGESTELTPAALRYALETVGIKVPDINEDYMNQQYDAVQGQAQQYAVSWLTNKGINMPTRETFPSEAAYMTAWTSWHDQVNSTAHKFATGILMLKVFQTTVSPGAVEISSQAKDAYSKFYTSTIAPQIAKNSGMTDIAKQEMDKWYMDHPASRPFMESYNWYTGKSNVDQVPVQDTGDKYYQDLQMLSAKETMSPEAYQQMLPAMMAKQYYDARLNGELRKISPTLDAPTLLSNWGTRRTAIEDNHNSMTDYFNMHPEAHGLMLQADAKAAQFYGYTPESSAYQFVSSTIDGLSKLAPLFNGTGGMPSSEFTTVLGKLRAQESKLYQGSKGTALDKSTQGIDWYFNNVITPYMSSTQPLYDKAATLQSEGKSVTDIYNQIDAIRNQYTGSKLQYGGQSYPSPDEFFFGSKGQPAQQAALVNWATKPVAWLSPWQQSKLGYSSFTGEQTMWNDIAENAKYESQYITDNNISYSSSTYAALKQWKSNADEAVAKQYGAAGTQALALSNAAPYVRISLTQPAFAKNTTWQNITSAAGQVASKLTADGVSLNSTSSSEGMQYKQWLYGQVEAAETADPAFSRLMATLSQAMPAGQAGQQLRGVPLYEAVFFGNFSQQYISPQLIDSVKIPAGNS